ncbi:MAG: putative inorganic carbon transporter subunit DabA [Verrucomicrobiota bacterium]
MKSGSGPLDALRHAVEHASHYLPAQGPIGVFIHHNTLHAFQHQPFEEAVVNASRLFGTEPYMSERAYRDALGRGRVLEEDVDAILDSEPDAVIGGGGLTRRRLRKALLIPGVLPVNGRNIAWYLEEGDMLGSFRQDLPGPSSRALASDTPERLWQACRDRLGVEETGGQAVRPRRPHEAVRAARQTDLDEIVHAPLIRIVGAFVDQGLAYWEMPFRELGLLRAARRLMSRPLAVQRAHLSGIPEEMLRQERAGLDAEHTVLEMLGRLAVSEDRFGDFVTAELLALPGWAGLVRCLEKDPALAPHRRLSLSLMEFLALRLTYVVVALEDILGDAGAWRDLPVRAAPHDPLTALARLHDAAQLLGLNSDVIRGLSAVEFDSLRQELERFNEVERRRVWHLAYERRHERQVLIPLRRHAAVPASTPAARPAAQVVCCIDEREESFRRALEEAEPGLRTYGAAGFFGCAIDYAGIDDAQGVSLCPVVVKPAHQVREAPVQASEQARRQRLRRMWGRYMRQVEVASGTVFRGAVSTALLGAFSLFPLLFRVLSPRRFARFTGRLNDLFLPEPRTELRFMREGEDSKQATAGLLSGFTVAEMSDRVASVLVPAGLVSGHARLVTVLGHGSISLNNPHESAHDCGACGGRRGGPNARLFAAMANLPEVRLALRRDKGVTIGDDVWFVGGYHDTCSDAVDLYDLERMPDSHRPDLEALRALLDRARASNALERARRFEAAASDLGPDGALRHVEERSEHLAEPRPEYGHCTNSVAVVGRRERTRGLFFDRRAFLVSYDPVTDVDGRSLAAVLGAVIPVCGGISLEYYFSFVDNEGYGCGTKLPHNVTGLVGVMNGYQGDLRTGLPLQMVEIHEPVRILFVIECPRERLERVIRANPLLVEFVENRWIRLAVLDPDGSGIACYRGAGVWEALVGEEEPLPEAPSSVAFYRGKSGHLPVARIRPPGRAA